ncbi:unnamed protein product [Closterium sp. Naga37s-1]|nr:unnamed protein product [Closterium sp. Naga37s-1]
MNACLADEAGMIGCWVLHGGVSGRASKGKGSSWAGLWWVTGEAGLAGLLAVILRDAQRERAVGVYLFCLPLMLLSLFLSLLLSPLRSSYPLFPNPSNLPSGGADAAMINPAAHTNRLFPPPAPLPLPPHFASRPTSPPTPLPLPTFLLPPPLTLPPSPLWQCVSGQKHASSLPGLPSRCLPGCALNPPPISWLVRFGEAMDCAAALKEMNG